MKAKLHKTKILFLIFLCGCGTIMNLSHSPQKQSPAQLLTMDYYGGLKSDIYLMAASGGLFLLPGLIDLPLTLLGDTLTLPIVGASKSSGNPAIDMSKKQPDLKHFSFLVNSKQKKYQANFREAISTNRLDIRYKINNVDKSDSFLRQTHIKGVLVSDEDEIKCLVENDTIIFEFPFVLDEGSEIKIYYE